MALSTDPRNADVTLRVLQRFASNPENTSKIAQRVVQRFMVSFQDNPMTKQVKISLQTLAKKASECQGDIRHFKSICERETTDYFDDIEEMLPEDLQDKASPILKMVQDIGKNDLSFDNIEDVHKAGLDLRKLPKPTEAIKDKWWRFLIGIADNLIDASKELAEKELPPLPWWSRNIDQASMIAKMHTEDDADKALVSEMEKIAKTINTMFIVGASLEDGLKEVVQLTDKALKQFQKVLTTKTLKLMPGMEVEVPDRGSKPKAPRSKAPKRPTFAQVRKVIFDHLKKEGWKLVDNLKIPHATSPDGDVRLWFKAQAVYGNSHGVTDMKAAHSWISDLRDVADPKDFMAMIARWARK